MKKLIGLIFAALLLAIVLAQVQFVNAKQQDEKKPSTSPATSACKPGWGHGDKNHCHSGPPGQNR